MVRTGAATRRASTLAARSNVATVRGTNVGMWARSAIGYFFASEPGNIISPSCAISIGFGGDSPFELGDRSEGASCLCPGGLAERGFQGVILGIRRDEQAIRGKELTTLDAVRAHTKASASCGSCTAKVEAILAHMGGAVAHREDPAMCKCTDHGHDAVRRAIREQELKTIAAVREALGWKTLDGCQKCRPALNYFLICAWPETYSDDAQSRFVNERVHANIQKDGTFSVVPRMWGGLTNSRELRAIADVAEKYAIPTVKVTGGQRIDLVGVPKHDLPGIWRDLDMPAGYAWGKSYRTCKSCIGVDYCRFGLGDSITMRKRPLLRASVVASGTVNPPGPIHRFIFSGSVHAAKTLAGDALRSRLMVRLGLTAVSTDMTLLPPKNRTGGTAPRTRSVRSD